MHRGRGGHHKQRENTEPQRRPGMKLMTKEEVLEKTSTEQILLIEEIAEKVTSNPEENVKAGMTLAEAYANIASLDGVWLDYDQPISSSDCS
jgi:hypothetical protein